MNLDLMWKVRDARGLTTNEKMFLYTIISRGEKGMWATADTNAADMGISPATYNRTRNALLDKNCITAQRRMNATTVYFVNPEGLTAFAPADGDSQSETEGSLCETGGSLSERGDSHSETRGSLSDKTKKNIKKNTKTNQEEELEEERTPAAPVITQGISDSENTSGLIVPSPRSSGLIEEGVSGAVSNTEGSHTETPSELEIQRYIHLIQSRNAEHKIYQKPEAVRKTALAYIAQARKAA